MTSSKQRKVIFFDFDGTICDPSDLISFVLRRILNEFEYNFSHDAVKKQGGKKIPDRLLSLGVANHKIGVIVKKFFNAVVLDVSKDTIKLCCSVEPLRELKEKCYEFVIISNN